MIAALVTACGDKPNPVGPNPPPASPVASLVISGADYVLTGSTTAYTATATLSDGSMRTVTPSWSSSAVNVATVDNARRLDGRTHGSATLTAAHDGRSASKTVQGFVDSHARANRHKPSGVAAIESILKWHLIPTLGPKRLDAITNEQVQRLKLALSDRAPKTVNNVLTVRGTLLKKAMEWGELERLSCVIKLLPNPKKTMGFHDFDQYERVLTVAHKRGAEAYLMVLLGGDAGLRLGEIVALEWRDVDLAARRLTVQRSDWLGHVTVPKGGRSRQLPMTQRLTAALKAARHLRSDRVFCLADGTPITRDRVIKAVRSAQRVASIEQGVHILRHHVLFAPGDERGTCAGDPGARRTRGPVDDTALHALESSSDGRRDPVARRTLPRSRSG
jgi:integrase